MTVLPLWHEPAVPPPFRVRPVRGETTLSFVFRLAAANELVRPTTLLRSIGHPDNTSPDRFMVLKNWDVQLNLAARQRLAIFAGIPLKQLARSLPMPGPRRDAIDPATPSLHFAGVSSHTRTHCPRCIAQIPGAPVIRVYSSAAEGYCRRHQLWLGECAAQPPVNLSSAPEIAKAIHRRDKLFRSDEDPDWISSHVNTAQDIMIAWRRNPDPLLHRRLTRRWNAREDAVNAVNHAPQLLPTRLLVLPETVILAEILIDPTWRRRIGLAELVHEQRPFYLHIAHRLGFLGWTAGLHTDNDPLRRWVDQHQAQHRHTYRFTYRHHTPSR